MELKHHTWYWILYRGKVFPALYTDHPDGRYFTENKTFEVTTDIYRKMGTGGFIPREEVTMIRPLEDAPPAPLIVGKVYWAISRMDSRGWRPVYYKNPLHDGWALYTFGDEVEVPEKYRSKSLSTYKARSE